MENDFIGSHRAMYVCNNYVYKLECHNDMSGLAVYHVVKRERNKWEEWRLNGK